jgi:hypothetical protein
MFAMLPYLPWSRPALSLGVITLATAIVSALAQPSFAQNEFEAQVEDQLEAVAATLDLSNYTLVYDPYVDAMETGITHSLTVVLEGGVDYTIVGVCDQDCSDLDLELFDGNENSIGADYETDDLPVVGVTPAWTSEFTLDVHMSGCSTEPCYYGVGVFAN